MRGDIPDTLRELASVQGGAVSRQQAIDHGLSEHTITSKVRSGRWQAIYRGVYTTFNGPVDRRSRLWATLLWAGPGALLSHESAAEIHRLTDKPAGILHVTVPTRQRLRAVGGIVVHRSNRPMTQFPAGFLAVTSVEDTILDLTDAAETFDDACGWVTSAFGRGLTSESRLSVFMGFRRRLRWRADLKQIIEAAAEGAHSPLEYRYDRDVERAHGLPRSDKQVPFTKPGGTTGRRDRWYAEHKVVVELDGKAAHPVDQRWADIARDRAAAAAGSQSLRYGWDDVRWNPCRTAEEVAAVLRTRGWAGQPKPCSPGCAVSEAIAERRSPAGAGR